MDLIFYLNQLCLFTFQNDKFSSRPAAGVEFARNWEHRTSMYEEGNEEQQQQQQQQHETVTVPVPGCDCTKKLTVPTVVAPTERVLITHIFK